jgi:predicted MFS family arabinose efflux permease
VLFYTFMRSTETLTREQRLARAAVALFFLLCGLTFASWAVRIPVIKDKFQLNEAQLGGVLFMLPLGSMVALPIAGWAVHRFGSRTMTTFSMISYALMLFGISQAATSFQLSAALFLFGFTGDIVNIAMNTQGITVQSQFTRPLMSFFHAMWSVGAMVGAVLGGLSFRLNMSTPYHLAVVTTICVLVVAWIQGWMLTDRQHEHGDQRLFALPDKTLLVLGVIALCCMLCEGAMADWSSLYFRQVLEDPSRGGTTGYTAFTFTMAFGRFTGDALIQRFRNRRVLIVDGLLIAAGMGLALALPHPWAVIIGYAAVGFGVATVVPIIYTAAGTSKTMAPSIALAAVSTIGYTGFLFGPPMIGYIAHATGLRVALSVIALLGLCIFLLSRRAVGK